MPEAKGKRATLRIVDTRCLDICPKGAVAIIDSNNPGEVMIVPAGTSTDAVASRLGLAERVVDGDRDRVRTPGTPLSLVDLGVVA